MRELHLKMSMSLDGFVAGPNGEADWIFRIEDKTADAWEAAAIADASLHIMGAKTFRDMIAWWPYADDVFANPMNSIPKAVFTQHGAESLKTGGTTQSLKDAAAAQAASGQAQKKQADPQVLKEWQDSYVAEGPIADEIAKMKRADGKPILAHGGAGFARSLIATGLVDRFLLLVHPVALGKGMPIFTQVDKPLSLKLEESIAFPNGAVAQIYRPV